MQHVLAMIATFVVFIGLLWFGHSVAGLPPGEATIASLVTLAMVGLTMQITGLKLPRERNRDR